MLQLLIGRERERGLGKPFFSNPEYQAFPLQKSNFKGIEPIESKRTLGFIDGGNQELVGGPDFSVQMNRLYFCKFDGRKRVNARNVPNQIEYFSATYATFRSNEIYYDTILVPTDDEFLNILPHADDLVFNSIDRTLMRGNTRADIALVASIARRFGECLFSKRIVEHELEEGDIAVIDGTLKAAFPNEQDYLNSAYDAALESGVVYCGISKSCGLFTDNGQSLLGAIQSLAEREKVAFPIWKYYPVVDILSVDHRARPYVVRLNPDSERLYRFEILREQAQNMSERQIDEVLYRLAENSSDIGMPGYPYGLVDADHRARVRSDEIGKYQAMLLLEMQRSGIWEAFRDSIRAIDTHDVLNRLVGL